MKTSAKIPRTKREIGQTTFSRLMAKAECDSWSLHEAVGFTAEMGNFYARFVGYADNGFRLETDFLEFGKSMSYGLQKLAPTKEQLDKMQNMIYDKVEELRDEVLEESAMEMSALEMRDTYDHINANFYTDY